MWVFLGVRCGVVSMVDRRPTQGTARACEVSKQGPYFAGSLGPELESVMRVVPVETSYDPQTPECVVNKNPRSNMNTGPGYRRKHQEQEISEKQCPN